MTSQDERPISELFSDAISQFGTLVRNELQLARAEFAVKATEASVGVGFLAGALAFSIPAAVLLLMGMASLLIEEGGMKPSTANFSVGAVAFVLVVILWFAGKSRLKASNLVPTKTVRQLKQDATAAREHI